MANKQMAGKKLTEFEFPVERGKIQEFAIAIGDTNPVYFDPEYAQQMGFDNVVMPVNFPLSFPHHLQSQNFVTEAMEKLEMDPLASVHGECEVVYERPVCAGESLNGEIVLGDIYEKDIGGGRKWDFVEMKIRFFDQSGELVIQVLNIFIEMRK